MGPKSHLQYPSTPTFFWATNLSIVTLKGSRIFQTDIKQKENVKIERFEAKDDFVMMRPRCMGKSLSSPLLFNLMLVCRLPIWPRTLFCSTSISFYSALLSYFVSDSHMHKCVQSYSFQKLPILLLLSSQRKELLYCSYE